MLGHLSQRKRRGFILLLLVSVWLNADLNVMVPNLSAIERELGIDDLYIGFIGSAFTILGALLTVAWGYLTDRYNRKKLLAFGVFLGEIPCFLSGFAQNAGQLLFLRSLTGIGIGVIIPVSFSLVADYFPSGECGRGNAFVQTALGIGQLVGVVVAGMFDIGWRLPFMIVAAPNFILAPLFYLISEEPKRGAEEPELKEVLDAGDEYDYKFEIKEWRKVFSVKSNIVAFAQSIAGTVPWGVLPYWFIEFFVREKGFGVEQATIIYLMLGMGVIVGGLYGGYMGDFLYSKKKNARIILSSSFILLGMPIVLGIILYPLESVSTSAMIVVSLLSMIGVSVINVAGPNIQSMLQDVNPPENRGTLYSLFNLTDSIGKGAGPVLGGVLISSFGMTFAMATSALFWIPCALLWLPFLKTFVPDVECVREMLERRAREMKVDRLQ